MAETTKSYRMVGAHTFEVRAGDKSLMLAPGEFVDLTTDDVKENKSLIDLGILIDAEKAAKPHGASNESEDS